MAAAEMETETFNVQGPSIDKKLVFFTATSTENSDFITFDALTTIEGAYLMAADYTVGTFTFATNVLTVTNGGVLVWTGFVWGV